LSLRAASASDAESASTAKKARSSEVIINLGLICECMNRKLRAYMPAPRMASPP
jgi:hypothetical protein